MKKTIVVSSFLIITYCISFAGGLSEAEKEIPKVKYYFKLSDSDAELLIKRSREIVKGDDYNSVIKRLGAPDISKPIHGKQANSPVTGKVLRYYIARYDRDLVNELLDEYVMIVLSADNTVTDVAFKLSGDSK